MENPNMLDKSLRDLLSIIQFTEKVSADIHGLLDADQIYSTIDSYFRSSKDYNATIALLNDNRKLIIKTASNLSPGIIRKAEKFAGIALNSLDLLRSKSFKKVMDEGNSVLVNSEEIVCDFFPKNIAHLIAKMVRYEYMPTIISPIYKKGKIMGVLGVNSPFLGDYYIPSVENLCKHISASLELGEEITNRKKAEEKVRELNETLEKRVAEQTEELMAIKERLHQSEKMEAIGRLAGGVAHDFNNQLAGMMGCADLLRSSLADNQSLYDLADMIVKAAERSSQLTKQLLAFARKGKYQTIPQNIHTIINDVISILERSISKKISLRQHLNAQLTIVNCDPAQLHNAFLNIALNAKDAMPNGGELIFSTGNLEFAEKKAVELGLEAGRYIQIGIKDTGIGINADIRSKLFEPFFTTKEQGKGTGLGLAAVYGIVKNHKGNIEVQSQEGKGSLFNVLLPVSLCKETAPVEFERTDTGNRAGTILIADDESLVLDTTSRILKKCGYSTILCGNGREAVELFKKFVDTIDIVILDLIMPELDGFDAFSAIRDINPKIKVIFSSGYSADKAVQEIIDKGDVKFVQKPFLIDILLKQISNLINS